MDSKSLLAFYQIVEAVMTQLQPVLNGFNDTLENLSREVEGLSIDLKNLRHEQESMSKTWQAHEEKCEKDLKKLNSQQKKTEQTVHLQQEHLLHNMTSIKDTIDHYINASHEDIQVTHHCPLLSSLQIKVN